MRNGKILDKDRAGYWLVSHFDLNKGQAWFTSQEMAKIDKPCIGDTVDIHVIMTDHGPVFTVERVRN